jgi:hypothetical protein
LVTGRIGAADGFEGRGFGGHGKEFLRIQGLQIMCSKDCNRGNAAVASEEILNEELRIAGSVPEKT